MKQDVKFRMIVGALLLSAACAGCGKKGVKSVSIPVNGTHYKVEVLAGPGENLQGKQWEAVKALQRAMARHGSDPIVELRTDGMIHVTGISAAEVTARLAQMDAAADRVITPNEIADAADR